MFHGQLFETQKPAAAFLCNKKGALLAWEQGTGKTVISIAAAEKLFELGKAKHALVIAQSGNAWQWEDSIKKFTDAKVTYTQAKEKDTRTYRPKGSGTYWVTSWNLFRNDYDTISKFPWDIVIADEAQEFRNFRSKTAKLIKRVALRKPTYRWALTGTAISTKLEDLYSIFQWVDPTFLPPWPKFAEQHVVFNSMGVPWKYKNLNSLNIHLQGRMDRKTHADQKGMPKLVEQIHTVERSTQYRKIENKLLGELDDMVGHLAFDEEGELKGVARHAGVSKAFDELRQALSNDERKLGELESLTTRILSENPSNRIVVFSHYKEPLRTLCLRGLSSSLFTGDQSVAEKRASVERFRRGDDRVLLCSNAGRAGLDLPFANYIIHIDIPFSHEVLDQRNKRITRINSSHSTAVVIYLVMEDSIEQFYFKIVKSRGELAKAVKEGGADEVIVRAESLRSYIRGEDKDDAKARRVSQTKQTKATNRKTTKRAKPTNKTAARKRRPRAA